MSLTLLIAGALVLGQVPAAAPSAAAADPPRVLTPLRPGQLRPMFDTAGQAEPAPPPQDDTRRAPGGNVDPSPPSAAAAPRFEATPADLLATATVLPAGSGVAGQPLTLLTALSSAADPRQQLEIVHCYWRLVEAVAIYHFYLDYQQELGQIGAQADEAAVLQLARTSASALLREAEVAATAAQHDLAALVRLPADAPLPLPADRPHAGPYRTAFNELFSTGIAPAQVRLIDRLLPIRHRAIDGHAAAIQAADQALQATTAAQAAGRAGMKDVLTCLNDCLKQRQGWMISVCRYNHDIAEYAVAVVGPAAASRVLLGMLIKPSADSAAPAAVEMDPGVRPAGLAEPAPTPPQRPGVNLPTPARRGMPTPAKRPPPTDPPGGNEPTSASPVPAAPPAPPAPAGKNEPTLAPPEPTPAPPLAPEQPPTAPKNEPTPTPPQGQEPPPPAEKPIVPIHPEPGSPTPQTAHKPLLDDLAPPFQGVPGLVEESKADTAVGMIAGAKGPAKDPGGKPSGETIPAPASALYPALVDAAPAAKTTQLAAALHWDRSLPKEMGRPLDLAECLRGRSSSDRRAVVEAYWLVRQRAADYQATADEAQWLNELAPRLPSGGEAPATYRLRSAVLATGAALSEAEAALIEAQYDLAAQSGHLTDPVWPLPAAVPHAGAFPLASAGQSPQFAQSWPLRRMAVVIAGFGDVLQRHAAAVVEADAVRANLAADRQAGGPSIERALTAIDRQAAETLSFLHTLTAYNRAIADYVLTVYPAETPAENVVAALAGKP